MRNYSIDLAALSSVLLLAGCGNLSIPTGLSEDRYLDPNGVMVVATNLQGATFDANERWVELKVDQSRLAQLHSVPQYMWQSGS